MTLNLNSIPLFPPKSTERRLEHFDETVFDASPNSNIYRLVDALCGDSGAGSLLKDALLDRLSSSLESIYFSDLDYIFGGMQFLERSEEESYTVDPMNDMLTSDEWDEVRIKDSWYRARISDFFAAATLGGTREGLRAAVQAATSARCEILEVWRFKDSYGLSGEVGRAPKTSRSEVVIVVHKDRIPAKQKRLILQMVNRIAPADTIVTVNTKGIQVNDPVEVKSITADSSYFEVQKKVTGTPLLDSIPPEELLAIDLLPSEKWLSSSSEEIAPYAAFNITQEYGYYYLMSGGSRSPIDSVQYTTSQDGKDFSPETNYQQVKYSGTFSDWKEYEKADSPDNFPGGKFGISPNQSPALTPSGDKYNFPYESQRAYVEEMKAKVVARGGYADDQRYRLPTSETSTSRVTYTPDLAVAFNKPSVDSAVTAAWLNKIRPLVRNKSNLTQDGVSIDAKSIL